MAALRQRVSGAGAPGRGPPTSSRIVGSAPYAADQDEDESLRRG
jgi:hypothetical protein